MSCYRVLGFMFGLLLAMVFVVGGAHAHGPVQQSSYGAHDGFAERSVIESSPEAAPMQAGWAAATDHALASSECPGEIDGKCCSQHCCVGATVAIETDSPKVAMELTLAENPPEAPSDLTLSGLLRPPCN